MPQKEADGTRSPGDEQRFYLALQAMGSCYASITGTSVLQVKTVPPRPKMYDGLISIVGDMQDALAQPSGLVEHFRLSRFGHVISCELVLPDVVHAAFVEHAQAEAAIEALRGESWIAFAVYNDRAYDGEDGRGWTTFEQGTSLCIAAHLHSAGRRGLLSKRFKDAEGSRQKVIDISDGVVRFPDLDFEPEKILEDTQLAMDSVTFTGRGDKERVVELLSNFDEIISRGIKEFGATEDARATEADFGAAVLEMAGACWVLPDFSSRLDEELLTVFRPRLIDELGAALVDDAQGSGFASSSVLRSLWGPGGPLSNLALESKERMAISATESDGKNGGLLKRWYDSIVASAVIAFLPTVRLADESASKGYEPPPKLAALLMRLNRDGVLFDKIKKRDLFADSFVFHCNPSIWGDDACAPLVSLVETMVGLIDPDLSNVPPQPMPSWLVEWRPLRTFQHGDMNAANVLLDVHGAAWLIDFAHSRLDEPFKDAAKMISSLLFEYLPVPLSVAEVATADIRKLRHFFRDAKVDGRHVADGSLLKLRDAALHGTLSGIAAAAADDVELQQLLPAISEDAAVEDRVLGACAVIDALFKPVDGHYPELWHMASRSEPAGAAWKPYQKLVFELCTTIIRLSCGVVATCSQREQMQAAGGGREAAIVPADVHASNLLQPLLVRALCAVRYSGLAAGQMRVAWYASQVLASSLTIALRRPPVNPQLDIVVPALLSLEPKHPISVVCGFEAPLAHEASHEQSRFRVRELPLWDCVLAGDAPREYSACSQAVLPWLAPETGMVAAIFDAPVRLLTRLQQMAQGRAQFESVRSDELVAELTREMEALQLTPAATFLVPMMHTVRRRIQCVQVQQMAIGLKQTEELLQSQWTVLDSDEVRIAERRNELIEEKEEVRLFQTGERLSDWTQCPPL